MTKLKPAGVSFETWVDGQVRAGQERGDFDDLPGMGKPLPGAGEPHDEQWWVKNYIRREGVSTDVFLPPSMRLAKEIERLPDTVRRLRSERAVLEAVEELNVRIADWLRCPSGPWVRVNLVDAQDVLRRWRAMAPAPAEQVMKEKTTSRPARWWRRIARRHP